MTTLDPLNLPGSCVLLTVDARRPTPDREDCRTAFVRVLYSAEEAARTD